jgi:hypothetical protein
VNRGGPDAWKKLVYRYQGPGIGNGVRVLLLRLADGMDERCHVSVPRPKLAADLGITEMDVKKRLAAAKRAQLIDNVVKGHNGMTAVYQGLFASTPNPSRGPQERTPSRGPQGGTPTESRGEDPRAPTGGPKMDPFTGRRGPQEWAPSSKSNHSDTPGREQTAPREQARAPRGDEGQGVNHAPDIPSWRLSSEYQQQTEPLPQSDTVAGFETEPTTCEWCNVPLVGPVQRHNGLCNRHWVEWRASLARSS